MKKELLPAQTGARKDCSARLMKERFSWMKSAICRFLFKLNFCACCRSVNFIPLGARSRFKSMSESSPQPIRIFRQRSKKAIFARIYFTGSMSFRFTCRPLRERKEDIPHLANHFLKIISQQMKKEVKGITPQAMQKLMLHDWPGNVRELENSLEYAVAMTPLDMITDEFVLQTRNSASRHCPNEQERPADEYCA